MLKVVAQKLAEANKLIFVKRYGEAEQLLDQILRTVDGGAELLVHLRRIELGAMLKSLSKLRTHYLQRMQAERDDGSAEICLAFVEQQSELITPSEAASVFQDILRRHGASAPAYYGIGCCMEQQGNHERAIYNYQQALSLDPEWYTAYFGLSQVYYQIGDERRGDHFFYMFEQAAPYNVYGNFETHRQLSLEFLQRERYLEAESAIQALSAWWIEHKGSCPIEIQIYELLAMARIHSAQGDHVHGDIQKSRAHALAGGALDDAETKENVLYFIAKVTEDFEGLTAALPFYQRILNAKGASQAVVQKIGSQLLGLGEHPLAQAMFAEAYQSHPENPDVRFCLLVANLKLGGVNVEEYLIGRERLRQLIESGGDKVETLALLHSLLAKFGGDSDVQGHIADVYLRLGNIDRAAKHYEAMYQLDRGNRATALKYAAFMMQNKNADLAMEVLGQIGSIDGLPPASQVEIYSLKSNFYAQQQDHFMALQFLRKAQAMDPWNVSYLLTEITSLQQLALLAPELKSVDTVLAGLSAGTETPESWLDFDQRTVLMLEQHAYELVYARCKLRYLYANGASAPLQALVQVACKYDAGRATYDFIRLLNTNFDSPDIYWALGILFKELWQLETATVWFEQMLLFPSLPIKDQAKAYLELADCFAWRGKTLEKAVEFAKSAMDLTTERSQVHLEVLAHCYLKAGLIRQATAVLGELSPEVSLEARYLHGLLHYRNGSRELANKVWKPLLATVSESLRFHTIKQDILKFYFEGSPYLKAN